MARVGIAFGVPVAASRSRGVTPSPSDASGPRTRKARPHTRRRDVTPHHLTFRSQGGGDEPENLISLCLWCHLFGVHTGRIRARGPASNIRWELGREPILVVQGRSKLEGRD